jgi:hypothetical protein
MGMDKGERYWRSIISSSDGLKLAAVALYEQNLFTGEYKYSEY